MIAILSCAFLGFSATSVAAQVDASVAPPPPISTEGYPQEPAWKTPVDYAAVIASERDNAAAIMAGALKEPAIALYTGYDRMLAYIQQDMVDNLPIEEIAEKNYIKVVDETPTDPTLVNMEASEFNALYVALLGMLHQ